MKLVCLPGLDGTGLMFDDFVRALPPTVEPQVVAYPNDVPMDHLALEGFVAPKLPTEPYVLLGESFSGPLALCLAAQAGPELKGLVLVATFHHRPVSPGLATLAPLLRGPLFSWPPPGLVIRKLLAGADASPALVARFRESVSRVRGEVLAARARSALAVDATPATRALRLPTLYLAGAHDALMRPALVDELRELMPSLEVQTLSTPHLVLQRAPSEAATLVSDFVRQVC